MDTPKCSALTMEAVESVRRNLTSFVRIWRKGQGERLWSSVKRRKIMAHIIQKRAQMAARHSKKAHSSCGSESSCHFTGNNCVLVPHNHVSHLPVLVYHACISGARPIPMLPRPANSRQCLMIRPLYLPKRAALKRLTFFTCPFSRSSINSPMSSSSSF
jgi:hypothetical protein